MLEYNEVLKRFWRWWCDSTELDPYFHIANVMWIEGYTDLEIEAEIYRLKRANNEL